MIGIYKITSPSGKVYIGQSVNITARKKAYERVNQCKGQKKLYSSIVKYGFSEHIFEVVEECSVEELNIRERYWQEFYDVIGSKGLNCLLTPTDELARVFSEETRAKISASHTGKTLSEEHKDKIREKSRLFKHSEESKRKMCGRVGPRGPHKNPRKKTICPHCNKEGDPGSFARFHFDNCKSKLS